MKATTVLLALVGVIVCGHEQSGTAVADVNPGYDVFVTGSFSKKDWGGALADVPPIPADFFNPGSLPFSGTVQLVGVPLGTYLGFDVGDADTITRRIDTAVLPSIGSQSTVQFELVALQLKGAAPIKVRYNNSKHTELWAVTITESTSMASTGTATITLTHAGGGTLTTDFDVYPLMTFTNVKDGSVRQLDLGAQSISIPMETAGVPKWEHQPTHNQLVVPGLTGDETNMTGAPWTNDFYVAGKENHTKVHNHPKPAQAAPAIVVQNACQAGKVRCVLGSVKVQLACHAKAESKAPGIVDAACLSQGVAKFNDCYAIKELQPPCLTTGDAAATTAKIDDFVLDVVQQLDPAYPAPTVNKCSAGKKTAVAANAAAKLKCVTKAFSKGLAVVDPICLAKAETKFSKAWAKLEAQPPCLTTGDDAALELSVDTFVADVEDQLEGGS